MGGGDRVLYRKKAILKKSKFKSGNWNMRRGGVEWKWGRDFKSFKVKNGIKIWNEGGREYGIN